jgi:hypothetical protein
MKFSSTAADKTLYLDLPMGMKCDLKFMDYVANM